LLIRDRDGKFPHLFDAILAAHYTTRETTVVGTGDCTAIQAPNPTALAAINYACGQRRRT
jgi:hypothetical protein